ncbi:ribonuclease H-like domain-containing protein [Chloroflexota bacterium]
MKLTDAYLDIETTGLSQFYDIITVIGIYLCSDTEEKLIQLHGSQVTRDNLVAALHGVRKIYTYNGRRFDLPFIDTFLGINLEKKFEHHDLMYLCWEYKLKGGFKAVERQLQIPRQTEGLSGLDAVRLWWQYLETYDEDSLNLLLRYNREDVINLKILRERLAEQKKWREVNQEKSCIETEVVW